MVARDTPCRGRLFTATIDAMKEGDVRSGSLKRAASAVGEGCVVTQAVHARFASLQQAIRDTRTR
jgi:hypothetical protein